MYRWPDLFEPLTDEQRAHLIQTLASSWLEGWEPNREDIANLSDLARGAIDEPEYMRRADALAEQRRHAKESVGPIPGVHDPHPLVPTVVLYDIMSEAATRLRGTLIALGEAYQEGASEALRYAEQFQQAGDTAATAEALDIEHDFNDLSYETLTYRLAVDEFVDEVDPDDRAKILWATAGLRDEYARRNADYESFKAGLAGGGR